MDNTDTCKINSCAFFDTCDKKQVAGVGVKCVNYIHIVEYGKAKEETRVPSKDRFYLSTHRENNKE